jgi:hypothetical protein
MRYVLGNYDFLFFFVFFSLFVFRFLRLLFRFLFFVFGFRVSLSLFALAFRGFFFARLAFRFSLFAFRFSLFAFRFSLFAFRFSLFAFRFSLFAFRVSFSFSFFRLSPSLLPNFRLLLSPSLLFCLTHSQKEKIKIETSQREREKKRKEAGLPYDAKFFVDPTNDEEAANWKFKNEITVNREFIEYFFFLLTPPVPPLSLHSPSTLLLYSLSPPSLSASILLSPSTFSYSHLTRTRKLREQKSKEDEAAQEAGTQASPDPTQNGDGVFRDFFC